MAIRFRIEVRDRATLARTGVVATERGEFRTPAFLPVGTAATVKGGWPFPLKDGEVAFRSHIDGWRHVLSPELAVGIQEALGSDIRMVLDECVEYPAGRREVGEAVRRTTAWGGRRPGA